MADKDFRVKNRLHVNGLSQNSGVILATNNALDAHTNVPTQYGGTGTTTSPSAGQFLYSSDGTTYAPTNLSTYIPSAATPTTAGTVLGITNTPGIVALGSNALESNTFGIYNVGIGKYALGINTTGDRNIAIGYMSLGYNTTTSQQVAVGDRSLENNVGGTNTAIGYISGRDNTSGSNNIIIGNNAQTSTSSSSNEIVMGNSSITKFRVPGLGIDWDKNIEIMAYMGAI